MTTTLGTASTPGTITTPTTRRPDALKRWGWHPPGIVLPPARSATRGGRIAAQVRCGREWAPSENGVVVRSGGAAPGLARPRATDADHGRDRGGDAGRACGGAPDRHGGRAVPAVRGPSAGIRLGRPRDDGQDPRPARRRLCRG